MSPVRLTHSRLRPQAWIMDRAARAALILDMAASERCTRLPLPSLYWPMIRPERGPTIARAGISGKGRERAAGVGARWPEGRRAGPRGRRAARGRPGLLLDDEEDLLAADRLLVEDGDFDGAVVVELQADVAPLLEERGDDPDVADVVDAELARLEGDRLL